MRCGAAGVAGVERMGKDRSGQVRRGVARQVRFGEAGCGVEGSVAAWQGPVGRGRYGMVW